MTRTEGCCGCGAVFPACEGPTHRYMTSSPACWAAFGRVLVREYSDPAYARLHRLSVDAYAVQHPGSSSPQTVQSVAAHLCRLCVILEHAVNLERANQVMLGVKKKEKLFRWLEPPDSRGSVTVLEVEAAAGVEAHLAQVQRWAESSWNAWSAHHATIRSWLPSGLTATKNGMDALVEVSGQRPADRRAR